MSSPARKLWDSISARLRPTREDVLPDYAGGSILNLVQSIGQACGATTGEYAPLRGLDARALRVASNLVLLVVDGLGLRHLERSGKATALSRYLRGAMTSVFPSTTASAITTIMTGLAPQQHALTGWHIYFSEIDRILASLPMTARDPGPLPEEVQPLAFRLFGHRPIYADMQRRAHVLAPSHICASPFNRYHSEGAERHAYDGIAGMFQQVTTLLKDGGAPLFIYAYYPQLDALAHSFGIASAEVAACLDLLDQAFSRFVADIRGENTMVLATADHGFIDSPVDRLIELERHPDLAATLARPLCGERRVAYCYVQPDRRADFERYVTSRLSHAAVLHRSADLMGDGWFGPGAPHPKLAGRIGDYALVMKANWTIKDWLPGEKRHAMIGVHGGISAEEMLVPLIAVDAGRGLRDG